MKKEEIGKEYMIEVGEFNHIPIMLKKDDIRYILTDIIDGDGIQYWCDSCQIKKEARATAILFAICFIWHAGFGYLLSGSGIKLFGLPLWWILSTPGVFVVAVVGVIYLLKNVFVNFSLDDDDDAGKEA